MWRVWWAPNNASRWQMGFNSAFEGLKFPLTFILPTWRIWWVPNNASSWQMGFNSPVKGLKWPLTLTVPTWRIWWAPNNASRLQMGFNSPVKGLIQFSTTVNRFVVFVFWGLEIPPPPRLLGGVLATEFGGICLRQSTHKKWADVSFSVLTSAYQTARCQLIATKSTLPGNSLHEPRQN